MATSQELNPVRVLHSISGSYEPLSLVGTQAATRIRAGRLFLSRTFLFGLSFTART